MRAVASGVEAGPVMVHHQVLGRRLGAHTGRPPPIAGFPWRRCTASAAPSGESRAGRGQGSRQAVRPRSARRRQPARVFGARAVTPNERYGGCQTTKYPTRRVLHDFAQSDADFRRGRGDSLSCVRFPLVPPASLSWSRVSLSLVPPRARHRARSRPALGRSPPRLGARSVPTDCSSIGTTRHRTSIVGPVPSR